MFTRQISSKRSALLAARAQGMRSSPTWSEALLWRELSGKKLGAAFRRQVPIAGRFVVDFLAARERLIVEVDGGYHACRAAADARRDRSLLRLGYRVLRLDAALVVSELPVALRLIREALAERR